MHKMWTQYPQKILIGARKNYTMYEATSSKSQILTMYVYKARATQPHAGVVVMWVELSVQFSNGDKASWLSWPPPLWTTC